MVIHRSVSVLCYYLPVFGHILQKYAHFIATLLLADGDTDTQIFESVRVGRFDFPSPEWDKISETAKEFISAMLKRDPSKRPSAAEALTQQWIKGLTEVKEKPSVRSSIVFASRSIAFIKYRDMQKLQKSALSWLAANSTNEDITSLKDIFDKIDVNNDGTVTLQELDKCLENGG